MNKKPLNISTLTENFGHVGPVTSESVQLRARELAVISGRISAQVTPADYEQARRELTGGPELDRQEEMLDAIPEERRGDPLPSSSGRQMPEAPNEDEDDEERGESAQLVEAGVKEAEHDQMLQAARAAGQLDHETS